VILFLPLECKYDRDSSSSQFLPDKLSSIAFPYENIHLFGHKMINLRWRLVEIVQKVAELARFAISGTASDHGVLASGA